MFTANLHLYDPIQNLNSLVKSRQRHIMTHSKKIKKTIKISNITFAILPLYQKKIANLIVILSALESTNLVECIKMRFMIVYSPCLPQNLEFINLKCVTYTQRILGS